MGKERSYPGRRAGPPTGRMRVVHVRQRGATKGGQIQGLGPKYEWGEALKHKEMPERDCGHSSWVGYPSGGGPSQARMVPPHGGMPDPRGTGSQPGLPTGPRWSQRQPSPTGWKWGCRYRHRWREKRGHRAKARNEQLCQRVSGEQQATPNHAHQAKTGSLRMEARRSRAHAAAPRLGGAAHAQHVRDRGWGSHE